MLIITYFLGFTRPTYIGIRSVGSSILLGDEIWALLGKCHRGRLTFLILIFSNFQNESNNSTYLMDFFVFLFFTGEFIDGIFRHRSR